MRNLLTKSLLLLGLSVALVLATTNWKPLFNGTTFAGWHVAGASTYWTIDQVDSAIVGASTTVATPYTMVFSDKTDFDQFTIKYSYRLRAGCSGFFFRAVENTTAELLARYLAQRILKELETRHQYFPEVLAVEVEESFGQAATYTWRR